MTTNRQLVWEDFLSDITDHNWTQAEEVFNDIDRWLCDGWSPKSFTSQTALRYMETADRIIATALYGDDS